MTKMFLRFITTHPEFIPFLENGLAEAIMEVERKSQKSIFEMPQTVSWELVASKMPRIYYDLIDVVEEEKRRFS